MDFKTLQYFTVVARELNFTKAAQKLQMSQPPLSIQIRQLEEDLGAQLFIRGHRKLALTEAGELLLRRADQILTLADKTRGEITSLGSELSGKCTVGLVEGRAPFLAAGWIAGFREEYPLVNFSLWNGSTDDVLEQLSHGLVDTAVIAAPYDTERFDGIAVGAEPWVALIPADHPLAKRPGNEILLKELSGQPLIIPQRRSRVEAIRRWFDAAGVELNEVCNLSSYVDAAALVTHGVGICIFPQTTYTPDPNFVSRIITGPAKKAEYDLVWNREQGQTSLTRAFIDYVRDAIEEEKLRTGERDPRASALPLPEEADLLA